MKSITAVTGGLIVCMSLIGCTLPSSSRTAVIKDIMITQELKPDNVLVHAGDEIRWVNLRTDHVQLDIPRLKDKDLACRRGFANWLGMTRETVQLKPNETVSLCFEDPTMVNYNVRVDRPVAGGRELLSGTVRVAER
jgi:plastocyanin